MTTMRLSLVVAMDENGVIGADGGMPWHLPADLKHFKRTTLHRPILMGRRTHESIGRALPDRDNLVLTRNPAFAAPGCQAVDSIDAAVARAEAAAADELMVIGGAEVYAQALPRADRIYLTRIHAAFEGDTRFPNVAWAHWHTLERERHEPDARNPHAFTFMILQRRA